MKNKAPACAALTTLLVIIIIILSANDETLNFRLAQANLIDETCDRIFYMSEECVKYLSSDPRSYKATDVRGLALIMLEKTLYNATDTYYFVYDLRQKTTDPELTGRLSVCVSYYIGGVLVFFQNSLKKLNTNSSFLEAAQNAEYGTKNAEKCAWEVSGWSSIVWKKSRYVANLGFVTHSILLLLT